MGGYTVRQTLERSRDRMMENVIHPGSFRAPISRSWIVFPTPGGSSVHAPHKYRLK